MTSSLVIPLYEISEMNEISEKKDDIPTSLGHILADPGS
jgi:hypothetical protein